MAEYTDREAFIPYRKADVIELCVQDGKLDAKRQQKFREFCEILGAYYHFEFHELLEKFKDNYAPFNPDSDTKPMVSLTTAQLKEKEQDLVKTLGEVLQRANYTKLTKEALDKALEQESLITLQMDVDFDDFDQMEFYHRGDSEETVQVRKMVFKKLDLTMETYNRVVMLLKFKDEAYFRKKKQKIKDLNFTPGGTYVYMYKNIPKADIEVLYPNVKISMKLKDKMMLALPAAGAGIGIIFKSLATITVVYFVVLALLKGEVIDNAGGMQAAIAFLSLLAVFGGFMFKQYVAYKNKRISFLKGVTDTLFFKSLDSNAGVFNMIIDSAEEEECKEVILAYYHLLTNPQGFTQEELDNHIEGWLEEKFQTKVDFNVEKAVRKLEKLVGKLEDGDNAPDVHLMKNNGGKLSVVSIDDSKTIIDYVWDNIFQYN